jgi:hypothetical protein
VPSQPAPFNSTKTKFNHGEHGGGSFDIKVSASRRPEVNPGEVFFPAIEYSSNTVVGATLDDTFFTEVVGPGMFQVREFQLNFQTPLSNSGGSVKLALTPITHERPFLSIEELLGGPDSTRFMTGGEVVAMPMAEPHESTLVGVGIILLAGILATRCRSNQWVSFAGGFRCRNH